MIQTINLSAVLRELPAAQQKAIEGVLIHFFQEGTLGTWFAFIPSVDGMPYPVFENGDLRECLYDLVEQSFGEGWERVWVGIHNEFFPEYFGV